jgi:diguanylate cyclase (GGDEF)-like protein
MKVSPEGSVVGSRNPTADPGVINMALPVTTPDTALEPTAMRQTVRQIRAVFHDQPLRYAEHGVVGWSRQKRIEVSGVVDKQDSTTDRDRIDRLNAEAWGYRFSDLQRCMRLSQKSFELSERFDHLRGRAYAVRNLGFCAYASSEYERSLELLTQGTDLGRDLEDDALVRDCLNFTAAVYASLGDYEAACGIAQEAYRLSQALEDLPGQVYGLMNLGILYHQLGRHEASLETQLEALGKSREIGDQARETAVLINLGTNYVGLKRYTEAVQTLREALVLAEHLGLTERKTQILVNLGEALGYLGAFDEALEALERARMLIGEDGPREGLVYCLLNEGTIHLERGAPEAAIQTLESGLREAVALGSKALEFQLHERLAQAHKDAGDHVKALEHFERFHQLERQVRDQDSERKLRAFTAQREIEKAHAEAEIERLRNVELARALEALEVKSHELQQLVVQDPLTHLYNRRYLETSLSLEYAQAAAANRPLPLAMLDVDDFKQINDQFSHQLGDEVLIAVAELMRANLRDADIPARYGGEEFVLVLPNTTPEQAIKVCERLRQAVETHAWSSVHPDLRVTISLGLACDSSLPSHEKLLSAADANMYHAKRMGKNRLHFA